MAFHLPRCHATRVHTGEDMLSLFPYAIYARRKEIRPGTIKVKSQGHD
jgi:hypothetical protein